MEYKGYIAEIEYDDSVDLLHGRVVNAGPYPIATFEASDVEGLKREFRISIEEYLTVCAENDIQPQQPFPWRLNLSLDADLHARIAAMAAQSGMSINAWIKEALERETAPRKGVDLSDETCVETITWQKHVWPHDSNGNKATYTVKFRIRWQDQEETLSGSETYDLPLEPPHEEKDIMLHIWRKRLPVAEKLVGGFLAGLNPTWPSSSAPIYSSGPKPTAMR